MEAVAGMRKKVISLRVSAEVMIRAETSDLYNQWIGKVEENSCANTTTGCAKGLIACANCLYYFMYFSRFSGILKNVLRSRETQRTQRNN